MEDVRLRIGDESPDIALAVTPGGEIELIRLLREPGDTRDLHLAGDADLGLQVELLKIIVERSGGGLEVLALPLRDVEPVALPIFVGDRERIEEALLEEDRAQLGGVLGH